MLKRETIWYLSLQMIKKKNAYLIAWNYQNESFWLDWSDVDNVIDRNDR